MPAPSVGMGLASGSFSTGGTSPLTITTRRLVLSRSALAPGAIARRNDTAAKTTRNMDTIYTESLKGIRCCRSLKTDREGAEIRILPRWEDGDASDHVRCENPADADLSVKLAHRRRRRKCSAQEFQSR